MRQDHFYSNNTWIIFRLFSFVLFVILIIALKSFISCHILFPLAATRWSHNNTTCHKVVSDVNIICFCVIDFIVKHVRKDCLSARVLSFAKQSYCSSSQSRVQYTLCVKIAFVYIILGFLLDILFRSICYSDYCPKILNFLPHLVIFPVYLQRHAFHVCISRISKNPLPWFISCIC